MLILHIILSPSIIFLVFFALHTQRGRKLYRNALGVDDLAEATDLQKKRLQLKAERVSIKKGLLLSKTALIE